MTEPVRAILTDLEGTAIPMSFMTGTLVSFARERLGSYIAQKTAAGDFPRIALGIGVMCIFVMAFNHFVWRRLYRLAEDRMHF